MYQLHYAYMVDSFLYSGSGYIELAGVYVYVAVCTPISLSAALDSFQAIHSLLLQVINWLDAIEPRITAIEQNALISITPSSVPSYTSSLHDDKAFYSPLTRQATLPNALLVGCWRLEWSCCTSFSPPPVPMLPPAQPGPSYQQPSPSPSISPIANTSKNSLPPQPPHWVSRLPSSHCIQLADL